jgi:hypothetical protein
VERQRNDQYLSEKLKEINGENGPETLLLVLSVMRSFIGAGQAVPFYCVNSCFYWRTISFLTESSYLAYILSPKIS